MSRYCPNCGAVVPNNSLNCPQCFVDIPRDGGVKEQEHIRENITREQYGERMEKRHKDRQLIMLLAVIPAFFGLLGLGQIYRDRRDMLGWTFLGIGLFLYILLVVLGLFAFLNGIIGILMIIPIMLIGLVYILTALAAAFDAYTGMLGLFRRFR